MEMTATTLMEITLYCINSSCKVKSINYYLESISKAPSTFSAFVVRSIKTKELLRCSECANHLIDKGIDFDSTDETYRVRSR